MASQAIQLSPLNAETRPLTMAIPRPQPSIQLQKDTIVNGVYLTVFTSLLTISYIWFVVPVYGSMGFRIDINYLKIVEAVGLLFISYLAIHRQQSALSGKFLGLFYLFVFPSTLAYYFLTDFPRAHIYIFVSGFITTVLALNISRNTLTMSRDIIQRSYSYRVLNLATALLAIRNWGLWAILVGNTIGAIGLLAAFNGPPTLTALNLSRVYEVREALVYGSAVTPYLVIWQANVINPTLVALGVYRRRYVLVATGALLQLVVFLYTGNRAMLFSTAFLLLVYILVSNDALFLGLLKTFIGTSLLGLSLYFTVGHTHFPSLFIRRVFFVPPQIRSSYFDFFSTNPNIMMSGTSIRFLFPSSYTESAASLIGEYYLDGAYANIGFITSAYADFGITGVLIFAILAGVVLSTIDVLGEALPPAVVAGIWTLPVYNFDSSRLSTTILTHGILLSMIVTALLRQRE